MGSTVFDQLDAQAGRFKVATQLPTSPTGYYGNLSNDVNTTEWRGGEVVYLSVDSRLYIQTSTSGVTAVWKRLLTQFATSTSTSTSTSSSTSTSTSTSSTTTP